MISAYDSGSARSNRVNPRSARTIPNPYVAPRGFCSKTVTSAPSRRFASRAKYRPDGPPPFTTIFMLVLILILYTHHITAIFGDTPTKAASQSTVPERGTNAHGLAFEADFLVGFDAPITVIGLKDAVIA